MQQERPERRRRVPTLGVYIPHFEEASNGAPLSSTDVSDSPIPTGRSMSMMGRRRTTKDLGSGGGSSLAKPTLAASSIRCCPADQWVPETHVINCMAPDCKTAFSLFSRKVHCKLCGRVFCSSCCATVISLPAGADASNCASSMSLPGSPITAPNSHKRSMSGAADVHAATAAAAAYPPSAAQSAASIAASSSSMQQHRICSGCNYEVQLVVSTRQNNGEVRRKSRGEFKLFQQTLLVKVLSFLPLEALLEVSLVSSDFYFKSRDNVIWYLYNTTRWLKDAEQQPWAPTRSVRPSTTSRRLFKGAPEAASSFEAAPVLQDATALSESEAAKRVISLHARYNYTQFLDFTRRQEMARCGGLSSFTVGTRILFSSPVRIAIVGPSRVGKTACVRSFIGDNPSTMVVRPTNGFTRYQTTVKLTGDFKAEVALEIFDVSGDDRYDSMRRFICRHCHAVGLCYNPSQKVTLVEAADIMMDIETALGPQPVVVCGLRKPLAASSRSTSTAPHSTGGGAPDPSLSPSQSQDLSASLNHSARTPLAAAVATENHSTASIDHGAAGGSTPSASSSNHDVVEMTAAASPSPSMVPAVLAVPSSAVAAVDGHEEERLEVTVGDAVGITVRGRGSLQCDILSAEAFFKQLIQSLIERLALGAMSTTTTMADISAETSTARSGRSPSGISRHLRADKTVAQDILNITMQPSPLDILLNRKE